MTNIVLILAKVGSLGLPGKNTWVVGGKPLLGWTIEEARKNKRVDRVYVSTNGRAVADIAQEYGANVIMRDDSLAKNENFLGAVDHAMKYLKEEIPDLEIICIPQCVVPFRDPDIIDRSIEFLLDNPSYDSAVTIRPTQFIPEATMKINAKGELVPFFPESQKKVKPSRQDSEGYEIDHSIETFRYNSWKNRDKGIKPWDYIGRKIKGLKQTHHNRNCFIDVHTPDDIKWLEFIVSHLGHEGMLSSEKGKKLEKQVQ